MTVTPASVLIVDDHPANLLALEAILEPLGQRVVRAGSSAEALARVGEEDFSTILLDVRMPDVDGVETAARIRARDRSRDVPILLLTASDVEEREVVDGYASGAIDYLQKPVSPSVLRAKVTAFIELHRRSQELKIKEVALARRERQARLGVAIGEVLARTGPLGPALQECAEAIVRELEVAAARIWMIESGRPAALLGSAGADPASEAEPTALAALAATRTPCQQDDVTACPLIVDERLTGALTLTAGRAITADELEALGSIASAMSVGIERKRQEEDNVRLLQRYQLAIRATHDTVHAWELDTGRVEWSDALGETFGLAGDEVGGDVAWWFERIHPADRDATVASIREAIDGGADGWQGEYRFRRADGSHALVLDRAAIARDAGGRPVRLVGAMQDITAQRREEEQRQRLIAALARSNAELDQFAYVASHDLKAPLRGIASLAQWIDEDLADASPQLRDHLALLQRRVHRLETLINAVLDYARAGRSREVRSRPIELGAVVAEVVELLAPPPAARIEVDDGAPAFHGDRDRLCQVLLNLIGNALKHARRDDVSIRVSAREIGDRVEVMVRDDGPGIPAPFHERVWGMFQTLAPRDEVEGAGIGLALVRKIVESKGGRAWIEPGEGGATVRFTWPRAE